MKINKLYISAFGKLKDFSLDLSDGLQVIYGENEAGKTTVCEFIKSVFYGTGKRSAGQSMSVREKYAPWDGTPAGGRIYFEHSGRKFFIERQFRKSDSTDKVTVTDIASGKTEACPPDIGKTLFGISLAAFERSVFIGNIPEISADSDAAGEINQRLSNAALTGEDNVSYAKVLKRLDDARFALISKSGRTGSRVADMAERDRLSEALAETDRAARHKQEILRSLHRTDGKLAETELKCEQASRLLSRAKDIENAQKLKEYTGLKEKLDEVTKELTLPDGTVADEMFIKKLEFGFSKLDTLREKNEAHVSELSSLEHAAEARNGLSTEEIQGKIAELSEEKKKAEERSAKAEQEISLSQSEESVLKDAAERAQNTKKAVNPALLIVGAVMLILGAAAYLPLKSVIVTAAVCALGIILIILSFVLRPLNSSAAEKAQKQLEAKQSEISGAKSELLVIKSEINNLEARIENLNMALNLGVSEETKKAELEKLIESERESLAEEQKKVLSFFGLPDDADSNKLRESAEALSGKAAEQKQIKIKLSYLSRDLGDISYEEAVGRLATSGEEPDVDIEEQKKAAAVLLDEKSRLREEKARLETELKTAFRNMADPEDLRREIARFDEQIAAKQEYFDAASIAREVLEESLLDARSSFGGALESETFRIFSQITGGAYDLVTVSDEFGISAEKSDVFGSHEIEYLSRGTKDQAYLALRLAISKLITASEPLPVILDDALSQYDDKRFAFALDFLKSYAEDSQICLFTCHRFVSDSAKNAGVNIIDL